MKLIPVGEGRECTHDRSQRGLGGRCLCEDFDGKVYTRYLAFIDPDVRDAGECKHGCEGTGEQYTVRKQSHDPHGEDKSGKPYWAVDCHGCHGTGRRWEKREPGYGWSRDCDNDDGPCGCGAWHHWLPAEPDVEIIRETDDPMDGWRVRGTPRSTLGMATYATGPTPLAALQAARGESK